MLLSIITSAINVVKSIATLGLVVGEIKVVGNILTAIGKALGIIKPETQVDELGDKALQAEDAGITPEQYEKYSDYVKAVEDFQIDPEKSKKTTLEQKVEKGIELAVGVTRDKFPEISVETYTKLAALVNEHPAIFTEDSMLTLSKELMSDPDSIDKIVGYLECSEKNQDRLEDGERLLTEMMKATNPKMDDGDARRYLYNI